MDLGLELLTVCVPALDLVAAVIDLDVLDGPAFGRGQLLNRGARLPLRHRRVAVIGESCAGPERRQGERSNQNGVSQGAFVLNRDYDDRKMGTEPEGDLKQAKNPVQPGFRFAG